MITSNFGEETWMLMLINLHISLIKKRCFRSFDSHSDKTVTHSVLLLDINNFSNKIVDVIRKSHQFSFKIVRVITIAVLIPLIFLWMPAYDVRALPADTRWRHDFPTSCCWVHLPIFLTPWFDPLIINFIWNKFIIPIWTNRTVLYSNIHTSVSQVQRDIMHSRFRIKHLSVVNVIEIIFLCQLNLKN